MNTLRGVCLILLVGLSAGCFNFRGKDFVPVKPANVPAAAVYAGGPDGGVWVELSPTKKPGIWHANIYGDYSGELWTSGAFLAPAEGFDINKMSHFPEKRLF